MPGINISYNGYSFSTAGRAHFSRQARYEADAIGTKPRRAVVTYTISQWFVADTFAENQAAYQEMLAAIRSAPEGQLLIADELGVTLVDVVARPQDDNLPDQWGQYVAECTIAFQATEELSTGVNATVSYTTPTAGSVTLKNVTSWREAMRTDRPTFSLNNRRETNGTVTAGGKILADPTLDEASRRAVLETERNAIRSIADHKQVTLAFGTFSQLVRIDNVDADIHDGSYELDWTLSASYRKFPDGTFVEVEYDVNSRDDRERSERITTVRGKIRASTLAEAQTKLADITAIYQVSPRTLRRSESTEQLIDGADDSTSGTADNYNELAFSLELREPIDILNWKLIVSDRQDAKSGFLITTFSGNVTALNASTALAKARDLGGSSYPILMNSTEGVSTSQINDDPIQVVEVTFSYEYARQGTLIYAEINSQTDEQYDTGESKLTVSGFCVAATEADALTMARSFKPTTGVPLSTRESTQNVHGVNGTLSGTVFTKVEFSYTVRQPPTASTIEYSQQVVKDYNTREITTTYSGTATAPTAGEANALIDPLIPTGGRVTKDERTTRWSQDAAHVIVNGVNFSVSFIAPLAQGTDDILEAEVTLSTTFSVDHAVFTNIPFGVPYVQPNCGITPALKQVSGSISAITQATAKTWARGKRALALTDGSTSGYEDPPDERDTTSYFPFSGTTIRLYRCQFTYSARYPELDLP